MSLRERHPTAQACAAGTPQPARSLWQLAECVAHEPRSARLSRIHGFAPDMPQLAVAEPEARLRVRIAD